MTEPVFVVAVRRTPIGRERGALAAVEAHELAAAALRSLAALVPPGSIERVVLGNVAGRGNVARMAALAAGLGIEVPSATVNAQCVSGLAAVRTGVESVASGQAGLVAAGGVDSLSNSAVWPGPGGSRRPEDAESLPQVRHAPAPFADPGMGEAADRFAANAGIGRDAQDEWAALSYARADSARRSGRWESLTAPVNTGDGERVAADELPRRAISLDRLARMAPAFSTGGSATAGNAAARADGAALVLLASEAAVAACGLQPLAKVLAWASAAGDPALPPAAMLPAMEAALRRAALQPDAISRWEINEAFAAKPVACARHFGLEAEAVNPEGGAIAFGHPFAASGAIILAHLADGLARLGGRYGIAAIAGAGGLGEAMIIERC